MKLLVGLGNPEPDYTFTRHNAGKDMVNLFMSKEYGFHGWDHNKKLNADVIRVNDAFYAAKIGCFMNEAGEVVKKLLKFYDLNPKEDLIIAYDELDLFVGEYKLAKAKGSRIHNGILSINNLLKTDEYWHLRIGVRDESIASSVQKTGRDPAQYVLERLTMTDRKKIEYTEVNAVIPVLNDILSKK